MPFFQRVGDRGSEIALPCRLSDRYQGYLRGCVCRQRKESCYEKQLIQCRKGVSCHVGVPRSKFNRFHYHYNYYMGIYIYMQYIPCDKWVLVNTAWRVFRLRMEERPPICRVAVNKLNKQSRTADTGVVLRFGGWERW